MPWIKHEQKKKSLDICSFGIVPTSQPRRTGVRPDLVNDIPSLLWQKVRTSTFMVFIACHTVQPACRWHWRTLLRNAWIKGSYKKREREHVLDTDCPKHFSVSKWLNLQLLKILSRTLQQSVSHSERFPTTTLLGNWKPLSIPRRVLILSVEFICN